MSLWRSYQVQGRLCRKQFKKDKSDNVQLPFDKGWTNHCLTNTRSIENRGWHVLNLREFVLPRISYPSECQYIRNILHDFLGRGKNKIIHEHVILMGLIKKIINLVLKKILITCCTQIKTQILTPKKKNLF